MTADYLIPKFHADLRKGLPADLRTELFGKARLPSGKIRLDAVHAGTPMNALKALDKLVTNFSDEVPSGVSPHIFRWDFKRNPLHPDTQIRPTSRTFMWTTKAQGFFTHAVGFVFFTRGRIEGESNSRLVAQCVWIHPRYRRRGLLTRAWDYFIAAYGQPAVVNPSPSMRNFMNKRPEDSIEVQSQW